MWTTASCKKKAWHNLAPNYGWALLLVLISLLLHNAIESVLSGISGLPIPIFAIGKAVFKIFPKGTQMKWQDVTDALYPLFQSMMISFLVICAVAVLLYVIYAVFIKNPMYCGLMNWFMTTREEKMKPFYAPVFRVFQPGTYRVIVKGMAWRFLWNSIWLMASCVPFVFPVMCTVLFAVRPIDFVASISENAGVSTSSGWFLMGILLLFLYVIAFVLCIMIMLHRRYAYFYVPFLLLSEPELGFRNILRTSKSMSKGQKSKMLLLDLSFFGWWILVVLSGGFLMFALLPYLYATYTELFFARKNELIAELFTKMPAQENDRSDLETQSLDKDIPSSEINCQD
jgi:uncharacterized membrane protein